MASRACMVSSNNQTEDLISHLPDCVLCKILSFLPTEDSVRTRTLSTRWKHLFSLVPVLDFDFTSSTNPYIQGFWSRISSDRYLAFIDFVIWVFNSINVQKIEKFRVRGVREPPPENFQLLSWISESIRRGVQELDFCVFFDEFQEPQMLPTCVFSCESITYLSMRNGGIMGSCVVDVPEDVCLPRLKKLEIWDLDFIDGDSFRRFFRGCPVLEKLYIANCRTGDIQVFDISVPSLKCLTINNLPVHKVHLVLNLPKVEHFTYYGSMGKHGSYSFQGFNLLVEAYIDFYTNSYEGNKALHKFVSVVSSAQKLVLCWPTIGTIQESGLSLPLFSNLTRLEIVEYPGLLLQLLDRTPRLEILYVVNNEKKFDYDYDGSIDESDDVYFPSECVPACVSLNLKEVRFEGFLTSDLGFKFAKYLSENAKVLDTLKISSRCCNEKLLEMRNKLLTLTWCSRACQIVV